MRRAPGARDRRCRFPGCENRRFLDAHHIHHWAKGGKTTLDNLLLLCRRHHRRVHEGGYRLDPDGQFYDRWGEPIPAVLPLPRGRPDELPIHHRRLDIDSDTLAPGTGERMDLDLAVDALVQITRV
jgi:HNH endonuclease